MSRRELRRAGLMQLRNGPEEILALAVGYGVIIRRDLRDVDWFLAHELVHVGQFEMRGLSGLLREDLLQRRVLRGKLSLLEREAIHKSAKVLGMRPLGYGY